MRRILRNPKSLEKREFGGFGSNCAGSADAGPSGSKITRRGAFWSSIAHSKSERNVRNAQLCRLRRPRKALNANRNGCGTVTTCCGAGKPSAQLEKCSSRTDPARLQPPGRTREGGNSRVTSKLLGFGSITFIFPLGTSEGD